MIGGTAADCLDFSARKNVSMTPCTFGTAERFLFDSKGQLKSTSGKKCLAAVAATQDAPTFIAKCAKGVPLQTWSLSH
jgi:Ricin-type beta-trefoil lectin domain